MPIKISKHTIIVWQIGCTCPMCELTKNCKCKNMQCECSCQAYHNEDMEKLRKFVKEQIERE